MFENHFSFTSWSLALGNKGDTKMTQIGPPGLYWPRNKPNLQQRHTSGVEDFR